MSVKLEIIGFLMGAAIVMYFIGYMVNSFPEAAHAETANQRAIAAGSWKHQAGYAEYQAFTEANK